MSNEQTIYEKEAQGGKPDPEEIQIEDRRIHTQPYDLVVDSLIDQINNKTIILRPSFQRGDVWTKTLSSRLIESILLHVPIPPCYLSQNENFELDVIDGQQRLSAIYRFLNNEYKLTGLQMLKDVNGCSFHELPARMQRQIKTHTLRLVAITNDSKPEIKFDVFQRLNTHTVVLNSQELRNCVYRGALNDLLKEAVKYEPWLTILNKTSPDNRMRDQELVLRFYGFLLHGVDSYKTPQKHWLNNVAMDGQNYSDSKIRKLYNTWKQAIDVSLIWFDPEECFRRLKEGKPTRSINRALFDLTANFATKFTTDEAENVRADFRKYYTKLLLDESFGDLIHRAVDHTKRTKLRFDAWEGIVGQVRR